MAKKKSSGPATLRALKQSFVDQGVRQQTQVSYIPFRSDYLNLLTGGGIPTNGFTEIFGDPGMFKSTLAAELSITTLRDLGGVLVIHDTENKLKDDRFSSLGFQLPNAEESDHYWRFIGNWPKYRLTIEGYFQDMSQIVSLSRMEDLALAKERLLDGTMPDREVFLYRAFCGASIKSPDDVTDAHRKAIEKNLVEPGQLLSQHRRLILSVIDSASALPAEAEVPDAITGKVEKANVALRAGVWSEQLRRWGWLDDRVACLHIAQKRLDLKFKGPSFQKAASTTAQNFYYTLRISLRKAAQGALYRLPDGTLLEHAKAETDDKHHQVGSVIVAKTEKSAFGIGTSIPLVMLNFSGTDVIWSAWKTLLALGLLKHTSGGWYAFTHDIFIRELGDRKVNFQSFFDLYRDPDEVQRLARASIAYVQWLHTGIVPETEPTKPKTVKKKTTKKKAKKK